MISSGPLSVIFNSLSDNACMKSNSMFPGCGGVETSVMTVEPGGTRKGTDKMVGSVLGGGDSVSRGRGGCTGTAANDISGGGV